MSESPKLPISDQCPYCHTGMRVSTMTCDRCHVAIEAAFPRTRLGQLPLEHQRFIEIFILASGSLKEIAAQTGVSYPTVRARLDRIIADLRERIEQSSQSESTAGQKKTASRVNAKLTEGR